MADNHIDIEVAFALPGRQTLKVLRVPEGTTAREAVARSGIADEYPGAGVERLPLGIWGREVGDGQILAAGDRVEIYRPLKLDPREARRALAAQGKTMGRGGSAD